MLLAFLGLPSLRALLAIEQQSSVTSAAADKPSAMSDASASSATAAGATMLSGSLLESWLTNLRQSSQARAQVVWCKLM